MWPIVQNLEQLKERYSNNWEAFLANSVASTWVGVRDNFSSEYLARNMGTHHIKYKSDRTVREELKQDTILSCENYELPVQPASQIRQADGIYSIVKGLKPLYFQKKPYYEVGYLKTRAQPNPYIES